MIYIIVNTSITNIYNWFYIHKWYTVINIGIKILHISISVCIILKKYRVCAALSWVSMMRSGFEWHLRMQNFEMNAMVAFNLFYSHLIVYKPANEVSICLDRDLTHIWRCRILRWTQWLHSICSSRAWSSIRLKRHHFSMVVFRLMNILHQTWPNEVSICLDRDLTHIWRCRILRWTQWLHSICSSRAWSSIRLKRHHFSMVVFRLMNILHQTWPNEVSICLDRDLTHIWRCRILRWTQWLHSICSSRAWSSIRLKRHHFSMVVFRLMNILHQTWPNEVSICLDRDLTHIWRCRILRWTQWLHSICSSRAWSSIRLKRHHFSMVVFRLMNILHQTWPNEVSICLDRDLTHIWRCRILRWTQWLHSICSSRAWSSIRLKRHHFSMVVFRLMNILHQTWPNEVSICLDRDLTHIWRCRILRWTQWLHSICSSRAWSSIRLKRHHFSMVVFRLMNILHQTWPNEVSICLDRDLTHIWRCRILRWTQWLHSICSSRAWSSIRLKRHHFSMVVFRLMNILHQTWPNEVSICLDRDLTHIWRCRILRWTQWLHSICSSRAWSSIRLKRHHFSMVVFRLMNILHQTWPNEVSICLDRDLTHIWRCRILRWTQWLHSICSSRAWSSIRLKRHHFSMVVFRLMNILHQTWPNEVSICLDRDLTHIWRCRILRWTQWLHSICSSRAWSSIRLKRHHFSMVVFRLMNILHQTWPNEVSICLDRDLTHIWRCRILRWTQWLHSICSSRAWSSIRLKRHHFSMVVFRLMNILHQTWPNEVSICLDRDLTHIWRCRILRWTQWLHSICSSRAWSSIRLKRHHFSMVVFRLMNILHQTWPNEVSICLDRDLTHIWRCRILRWTQWLHSICSSRAWSSIRLKRHHFSMVVFRLMNILHQTWPNEVSICLDRDLTHIWRCRILRWTQWLHSICSSRAWSSIRLKRHHFSMVVFRLMNILHQTWPNEVSICLDRDLTHIWRCRILRWTQWLHSICSSRAWSSIRLKRHHFSMVVFRLMNILHQTWPNEVSICLDRDLTHIWRCRILRWTQWLHSICSSRAWSSIRLKRHHFSMVVFRLMNILHQTWPNEVSICLDRDLTHIWRCRILRWTQWLHSICSSRAWSSIRLKRHHFSMVVFRLMNILHQTWPNEVSICLDRDLTHIWRCRILRWTQWLHSICSSRAWSSIRLKRHHFSMVVFRLMNILHQTWPNEVSICLDRDLTHIWRCRILRWTQWLHSICSSRAWSSIRLKRHHFSMVVFRLMNILHQTWPNEVSICLDRDLTHIWRCRILRWTQWLHSICSSRAWSSIRLKRHHFSMVVFRLMNILHQTWPNEVSICLDRDLTHIWRCRILRWTQWLHSICSSRAWSSIRLKRHHFSMVVFRLMNILHQTWPNEVSICLDRDLTHIWRCRILRWTQWLHSICSSRAWSSIRLKRHHFSMVVFRLMNILHQTWPNEVSICLDRDLTHIWRCRILRWTQWLHSICSSRAWSSIRLKRHHFSMVVFRLMNILHQTWPNEVSICLDRDLTHIWRCRILRWTQWLHSICSSRAWSSIRLKRHHFSMVVFRLMNILHQTWPNEVSICLDRDLTHIWRCRILRWTQWLHSICSSRAWSSIRLKRHHFSMVVFRLMNILHQTWPNEVSICLDRDLTHIWRCRILRWTQWLHSICSSRAWSSIRLKRHHFSMVVFRLMNILHQTWPNEVSICLDRDLTHIWRCRILRWTQWLHSICSSRAWSSIRLKRHHFSMVVFRLMNILHQTWPNEVSICLDRDLTHIWRCRILRWTQWLHSICSSRAWSSIRLKRHHFSMVVFRLMNILHQTWPNEVSICLDRDLTHIWRCRILRWTQWLHSICSSRAWSSIRLKRHHFSMVVFRLMNILHQTWPNEVSICLDRDLTHIWRCRILRWTQWLHSICSSRAWSSIRLKRHHFSMVVFRLMNILHQTWPNEVSICLDRDLTHIWRCRILRWTQWLHSICSSRAWSSIRLKRHHFSMVVFRLMNILHQTWPNEVSICLDRDLTHIWRCRILRWTQWLHSICSSRAWSSIRLKRHHFSMVVFRLMNILHQTWPNEVSICLDRDLTHIWRCRILRWTQWLHSICSSRAWSSIRLKRHHFSMVVFRLMNILHQTWPNEVSICLDRDLTHIWRCRILRWTQWLHSICSSRAWSSIRLKRHHFSMVVFRLMNILHQTWPNEVSICLDRDLTHIWRCRILRWTQWLHSICSSRAWSSIRLKRHHFSMVVFRLMNILHQTWPNEVSICLDRDLTHIWRCRILRWTQWLHSICSSRAWSSIRLKRHHFSMVVFRLMNILHQTWPNEVSICLDRDLTHIWRCRILRWTQWLHSICSSRAWSSIRLKRHHFSMVVFRLMNILHQTWPNEVSICLDRDLTHIWRCRILRWTQWLHSICSSRAWSSIRLKRHHFSMVVFRLMNILHQTWPNEVSICLDRDLTHIWRCRILRWTQWLHSICSSRAWSSIRLKRHHFSMVVFRLMNILHQTWPNEVSICLDRDLTHIWRCRILRWTQWLHSICSSRAWSSIRLKRHHFSMVVFRLMNILHQTWPNEVSICLDRDLTHIWRCRILRWTQWLHSICSSRAWSSIRLKRHHFSMVVFRLMNILHFYICYYIIFLLLLFIIYIFLILFIIILSIFFIFIINE